MKLLLRIVYYSWPEIGPRLGVHHRKMVTLEADVGVHRHHFSYVLRCSLVVITKWIKSRCIGMVLYQKHDWKRSILLFLFPCKVAAVFPKILSFLSFLVLFQHFLIITIKFYLFLQRIISCINTSFKLKFNDRTSSSSSSSSKKKKKKFY